MTNEQILSSVDSVVAGLVAARESNEGTVVTLPSFYSSGAPVQVRVSFDGGKFFVSDMGLAQHEAELMGASTRLFSTQARDVADQFGVLFDNHAFFTVHVDQDRLDGAIRVIGAASHKAVVATENKLTEQNDSSLRREMLLRIEDIFDGRQITRDVEFVGSSTHSWKFAAQIEISGKKVLFDTTSEAPLSIYSTHAKFSDIYRLEQAPTGVIAIPSFATMKPDYQNLLQQVANVVDKSIGDQSLRGLLAA